MRCNKARDYVSQDLDQVLPPDAAGKLRDHLDACDSCRGYRDDLRLGQRVLAATEPVLPDNFAWKLNLKLNQALQQTAGEVHYPWQEETTIDRWAWARNFGTAAAVGLAAVLALAMFLDPAGPGIDRQLQLNETGSSVVASSTADRRPLFQPSNAGLYQTGTQRPVSSSNQYLERGWSGRGTVDSRTIRRLSVENQRLSIRLLQYQQENKLLKAQLDTSGTKGLDLQHKP